MDEVISREAVIDMLDETKRIARQNLDGAVLMTFERVFDSLVNITNALEPKRGKWIHHPEIGWGETWLCDQCGEKTTSTVMGKPRANFCPNCGADMRGEQDG